MGNTEPSVQEQQVNQAEAETVLREAFAKEYGKGSNVFASERVYSQARTDDKTPEEHKGGFAKAVAAAVIIISLIIYYHSK